MARPQNSRIFLVVLFYMVLLLSVSLLEDVGVKL